MTLEFNDNFPKKQIVKKIIYDPRYQGDWKDGIGEYWNDGTGSIGMMEPMGKKSKYKFSTRV